MKNNAAFVFFGFAVVIFSALIWLGYTSHRQYQEEHRAEIEAAKAEEQQKIRKTEIIIDSWADKLANNLTEDKKHFVKYQGDGPHDSWNRSVKVSYSGGFIRVEKLQVRSAGPDGEFDTSDDIIAERKRG
jgi:hypothetical protein